MVSACVRARVSVCEVENALFSFHRYEEERYRDERALLLDVEEFITYREAETNIPTDK